MFDERNQWGCDNWIILWLCQMLCVGRDREGQKTREVECIFLPQSLRAICGTGEETHSLEPLQLSPLEAAVAAVTPPSTTTHPTPSELISQKIQHSQVTFTMYPCHY